MNIKRMLPAALAAAVAIGAAGGIAHAQNRDQDGRDAAALAGMKVTLTQAIATAEGQTGSRAIGADVSQEGGVTRIQVEVAGPQGVKTVLVDGATGQVTATRDGGAEDND
jgi:uncharacterized membrane protein YkoI